MAKLHIFGRKIVPLTHQNIADRGIMNTLSKAALIAGIAFSPLGTPVFAGTPAKLGGQSSTQTITAPKQSITLSIGEGQLVNVPTNLVDVFIADDKVADIQIKSQKQLYIFGKAGGNTTIYASDVRGNIVWSSNVSVGSNISSVDQMLKLAMPEAQISVATMNSNTVLLTGTVAAPEDAEEAERLVAAYMGKDANVISRLKMATPLQVNLKVRFAEVSRSLVRTIGANLVSSDASSGFKFGVSTGTRSSAINAKPAIVTVQNPAGGTTLGGFGKFLGLDIGSAFDLAERDGLITILSQPNLTALSGESADFLAGGEFPIPMRTGLGGELTVSYRKYGVSLAYTPTVLANGRISLRVKPEVSELSSEGSVTLNGFQIPALTVRRAETTIELGSGQSFMIAGLMSNSSQSAIDKAPGLGDVPILGNLFRSTQFRKGQTELVIVVTPYLVKPVNDGDIALPTDGLVLPNMAQQLTSFRTNQNRPAPAQNSATQTADAGSSRINAENLLASDDDTAKKSRKKSKKNAKVENDDMALAAPGFSL